MSELRIVKAGVCSTAQDPGRIGYRAYGVPQSGALDRVALELANRLVGNASGEAAIEMLYSGVTLRVDGGGVRVALAGAEGSIQRAREAAPQRLQSFHSVTLVAGDTLRIGAIASTACAYLAVEGGFRIDRVLDSASTYIRGSLGGFDGRPLRAGDVVRTRLDSAPARAEKRYAKPPLLASPSELRVMRGPQADRFDEDSLRRLAAQPYRVSTSSDRSGLRLEGERLTHVGGFDLTSEGVAPGSIQVPGSGLPVILIGDHPTVGGYPKIATIISADLPAAGRLRIGACVSFRFVDEDEAREAREVAKREIGETLASLCDAD